MNAYLDGLRVEGDPNEVDSFVACVTAVLKAWGRPADYDITAGLAGVVFSPAWDKGENCTAWWMEGGDDLRMDFLSRALGFKVQPVTREADWSDEVDQVYAATRALPPEIEHYLARLKGAVEGGEAVILHTWPAWSILKGWSEDVRHLPLATVPHFEDLCARAWGPHKSRLAYVLSPVQAELSRQEAVGEALCFGEEVAAPGYSSGNIEYGGALYEAAAGHMALPHYCEPCGEKDRDWSCAHRTVKRMLGTARSAAEFLARAGAGEGAQGMPLYCAQEDYAQMTGVLGRYVDQQAFASRWHDDVFRRDLTHDFIALKRLHDGAAHELGRICDWRTVIRD